MNGAPKNKTPQAITKGVLFLLPLQHGKRVLSMRSCEYVEKEAPPQVHCGGTVLSALGSTASSTLDVQAAETLRRRTGVRRQPAPVAMPDALLDAARKHDEDRMRRGEHEVQHGGPAVVAREGEPGEREGNGQHSLPVLLVMPALWSTLPLCRNRVAVSILF